jgi:hypothetical protein
MPLADTRKLTIGDEGTLCTMVCKRPGGDTVRSRPCQRVCARDPPNNPKYAITLMGLECSQNCLFVIILD